MESFTLIQKDRGMDQVFLWGYFVYVCMYVYVFTLVCVYVCVRVCVCVCLCVCIIGLTQLTTDQAESTGAR